MSENVTEFPVRKAPDFLIGPFEYYKVVIEGRAIPKLTGRRQSDGKVFLTVDGRFGTAVDEDRAYDVAWLLAHALAIGAGYSHLGAESKDTCFAPQCVQLPSTP